MTRKIELKTNTKIEAQNLRVKIIKAPLVDSEQLRRVIFARARAVVL
ncbi:MAG: hypothetical protein ABH830_01300 [Patescibacteria group bacterium]